MIIYFLYFHEIKDDPK